VRADGASFSVLVSPSASRWGQSTAPIVQNAIGAFAQREGIPSLDVLPAFKKAGDGVFLDYDHLQP